MKFTGSTKLCSKPIYTKGEDFGTSNYKGVIDLIGYVLGLIPEGYV